MNRIFEVVDDLEISRESIQVDLVPDGDGTIEKLDSGKVRIVPASMELSSWLPTLAETLRGMGIGGSGELQ